MVTRTLAVLSALAVLVSFGVPTRAPVQVAAQTPQAAQSPEELVITSGGVCICHAPLYVGLEQGIFEKHGIAAEIRRSASGFESHAAVLTGDADVSDSVVAVAAQAAQQGVETVAVMVAHGDPTGTVQTDRYFAIVASEDSGIRPGQVGDLRGKTVGVARGTIAHQYLYHALEANGVDPNNDITIQNVTPADLPSALQTGSVDAIVSWEPIALQSLEMIENSVEVYRGGGHIQYLFFRWMSPDAVADNPETVQNFVTAFAEAAQFVRMNPDETVEILAESFEGLDPELIRTALGYLSFDLRSSRTTQEAVQQGLDFAREVGALEGDYDFAQHYEPRFVDQVVTDHPEFFSDLPPIPEELQL